MMNPNDLFMEYLYYSQVSGNAVNDREAYMIAGTLLTKMGI